ncbi:MAG: hypothetical protein JSS58_03785 [Proteobacteria bacterium]|nr:hypothetical protein [Pseudomonadota bacterium]
MRDPDKYITRGEIIAKLREWQSGAITTQDVWDWASHRYHSGQADYDDWEDETSSVAHEMLGALDSLDMHFILVEDVSLHLAFLATPLGGFEEGLRCWRAAQATLDIAGRKLQLRDDPIYSLYCN